MHILYILNIMMYNLSDNIYLERCFIMATWQEIRSGVEHAANKAIKKTSEIADTASLRVKLKSLDVKLNCEYEKLGKLTYKQLKTSKSQAEEIAAVIDSIDSLRAEMKTVREKIIAIKSDMDAEKESNTDFEEACDKDEAGCCDSADEASSDSDIANS